VTTQGVKIRSVGAGQHVLLVLVELYFSFQLAKL
jgi:hypothetical protein